MATVVKDMDGDGRMDIVVLTSDYFSLGAAGSEAVYVFYQRAASFDVASAATAATPAMRAHSLAACDIDGDGKDEILVGYNGGDLTIHKLAANGTPLAPTTLAGIRSFTIDCLDLNGDGKSDVVTSGKPGFDVQVLLQGSAGLTEVETFPSTFPSASLIFAGVGDINGDAKPDILFRGFDAVRGIPVLVAYRQINGGHFLDPITGQPDRVTLDFPLNDINVLDVNSFTIVDLFSNGSRNIVAAAGGNQPRSRIVIATYAANGQLVSSTSFQTSDSPQSVRVADIDGDGRNDIVVFHNGFGSVGVHYQNAGGSFSSEQLLYVAVADQALTDQALAIGDLDSNGKRDIASASQSALFIFFQD